MKEPIDRENLARASTERIMDRTAALLVEHDDASLFACMRTAMLEEFLIYGNLYLDDGDVSSETPRGILGCSPLESLRRRGQP